MVGKLRSPPVHHSESDVAPVSSCKHICYLFRPGTRQRENLSIEFLEVDVRHRTFPYPHPVVEARQRAGAQLEVEIYRASPEAIDEEGLEVFRQVRRVSLPRHGHEDARTPVEQVAPHEELDLRTFLQVQQSDDQASQVLLGNAKELVFGKALEDRHDCLVVVRAFYEVLGTSDVFELSAQDGSLGSSLHIRLRREKAQHPRLADGLAIRADVSNADVVHAGSAVHCGEPVGLGNDQQLALFVSGGHLRCEL